MEWESPSVVQSSTTGEPVPSWPQAYECWAAIEPVVGSERFASRQFLAETTHLVTIRYKSGIDPTYRGKCGTRVFRILAIVDPMELHEWLEIQCAEEVPARA